VNLVVDASVVVRVLLARGDELRGLRERVHSATCHAPHLLDAEVGHVLRRRVANGSIEEASGAAALHAVEHLVDERYPHTSFSAAAWALRHNLSYDDALYAALAARLGHPLLTADARLANAPGLPCAVELV
jgi:predicted nucleic acid-binding protein